MSISVSRISLGAGAQGGRSSGNRTRVGRSSCSPRDVMRKFPHFMAAWRIHRDGGRQRRHLEVQLLMKTGDMASIAKGMSLPPEPGFPR